MAQTDDDDDDVTPVPPGALVHDRGPAGPERAQQVALERIAETLQGMHEELAQIRRLLEQGKAKL